MKIRKVYIKLKNEFQHRKKSFTILSIIFTLMFSIYNRILGVLLESLWHKTIGIYYLLLVLIKSILTIYIYKGKNKDILIFRLVKVLLILLNIFLILPITLLILNKRIVKISLIFSIAIALYVTIKTTKVIIIFFKRKKVENKLYHELNIIELMDVIVSILTLQNTLIAVNSNEVSNNIYYLTIVSSIVGFLIGIVLIINLKSKKAI